MHAAVGDSNWFSNAHRADDLANGFAEGCRQSNAVWGGGETPALRGIVNPQTIVLAGSAIGRIMPKSNRITGDVRDGDAIVMLASSGVHTNGLSLCRALADRLPEGYLTGSTMGDRMAKRCSIRQSSTSASSPPLSVPGWRSATPRTSPGTAGES